jgi:hypothetical protein
LNNQPSPFVYATSAAAICAALALSLADPAAAPLSADPTHVVVWREPGRYGGWPANHGIWSWGNEILVGFSAGHMKADAMQLGGPARHPIDRTRPEQHLLARTLDGGATWKVERNTGLIPPPRTEMAGVPTEEGGSPERPFPGADDLTSPDFLTSTVKLDDGSLVTATRRQVPVGNGIDIYRSADAGLTWTFVTTAVSDTGRGNPPSLVKLRDGRLAVTYGYRAQPYGIRARISRDGGKTWDAERILRADAADWDLGYPRSVQRPDGKIVTVYYYNDPSAVERYIAATIWDPGV